MMELAPEALVAIVGILLAVVSAVLIFWLTRRFYHKELLRVQSLAEVNQQNLQQQIIDLTTERTELNRQLKVLEQQASLLDKQLELSRQQEGNSQQQLQELKIAQQKTTAELDKARSQVQELAGKDQANQAKLKANSEKVEELSSKLQAQQQQFEQLQKDYQQVNEQNVQLTSSVEERKRSLQEQQELFEQQKKDLSDRFQILANEILDKKSQALAEVNKAGLNSVINPFQQSIDAFKKEVQEIHHRETSQRSELKKELEQLKSLNQQITLEAHELSTALKGQKKLQGNWGELVLENVLDRSGLQLGTDYQREGSFKTEAGRQRPDAVVFLPQNKHLIIDAKVSLNAYTRYVNADSDQERQLALADHVKAMGDRIQELADRDYYKIPGLNSPEVVFMFVPIESAFVEALKADETLFQKAIEKNVLVATPTTLLTSLNIVRQLWRYEDQNKHTVALAKKAEGVFNKLNTFLKSFEGIKNGLDKASEAYTKAEGQLISGKGNLVKQVGEFKNLAPAIKSELPSYFTDKAELEVDFIAKDDASPTDQDSH